MPQRLTAPELVDVDQWVMAPAARQDEILKAVEQRVRPAFTFVTSRTYLDSKIRIGSFKHKPTGLLFNLLPGGRFAMGLSDAELQTLKRIDTKADVKRAGVDLKSLMPTHEVNVPPFFCARLPLTQGDAERLIRLDEEDGRPVFDDSGENPDVAIHLTVKEARRVVQATGLRLISEAEREYATRAHTTTVFYFGNSKPAAKMARELCHADFSDERHNDRNSNGFGLVGLAVGDFCADAWHDSYRGAPTDGSAWTGKGPLVVRGGAAALWPWQEGSEWLLLLSAMRVPSDAMYEGMSGVRLAETLILAD